MPSARSTLAIVAALVYGTSVLAMPIENSYDLAERDYSDVAELDARMYDMDLEEYYVREGGATPAVATAPTTPVHVHHKHKGHHHNPSHKSLHSHVTEEPSTPSPDTATSKLSTREPKGGRGHGGKGRKGRGRKGKGRKGKGGAPPTDAAATPADASAEPPTTRNLEADDEMLSARESRGGKGRGGKGFKGRGRKGKGRKGKGGKGKGGAPPADAAAAPAEPDASPAEAPAARDISDSNEMLSARDGGGKSHHDIPGLHVKLVSTPVHWMQGADVIIHPSISKDAKQVHFPDNHSQHHPHLRTKSSK